MENMNFIKVSAIECIRNGYVDKQTNPTQLYLNCDLIGAVNGVEIILKGENVVNLGGKYYTRIRLAQEINMSSI